MEITNFSEFVRSLRGLERDLLRRLERELDEAAEDVKADARRAVPVESGRLQAGISDNKLDEFTHEVGVFRPDLYYAKFVEFGTKAQRPQPFLGPAAERARRRFPQRIIDAINREID